MEMPEVVRTSYGGLVAKSPFSWDAIKIKLAADPIDVYFGRAEELQSQYYADLCQIKKEWSSVDDFCKHRFLGYPYLSKRIGESDVKYVPSDAQCQEPEMRVHENDYPYYFEQGVKHYLLWAAKQKPNDEYLKVIHDTFPDSLYDVLWFENIPGNKSVQSVVHLHIIIRKK